MYWVRRMVWGCIAALLVLTVQPTAAQTRTVYWEQWNTLILDVNPRSNSFRVVEEQRIRFDGTFRFGTRDIERATLENISNLEISVNGQALQNSCSGQQRTFCLAAGAEYYEITYYFPAPVTNATINVRFAYTVTGALRVYPDGDQLWWDVLPEDRFGFTVGSSAIAVQLPDGYAPREGIDPVETYGAPADVTVNGTQVRAAARSAVPSGQEFSLRIQYPHDPQARQAAWQSNWDSQRNFNETVAPLLNLGLIGLSLLIGIGGVLFAFVQYRTRGKDPEIGPVPEFLTEPPSDVSPAVIGTLLDEKADIRDVMSIILDLAHRGYLVIEEGKTEGFFGIGGGSTFVFKRTDRPADGLRSFEQRLLTGIFRGNAMERTLESMRNVFYMTMSTIQRDLYREMVRYGFYAKDPESVKQGWAGGGILLCAIGVIGGFLLFAEVGVPSGLFALALLPVALFVVGVAFMVVSGGMPAKTRLGAEEAAKWRAFEKYLRNLEQYSDVANVAEKFDAYLPYTVAFGLNREWINRFKNVPTMVMPPWYFPTHLGGPWSRGYQAGSPLRGWGGSVGDFGSMRGDIATAGSGGFSFDDLSSELSSSLESMSEGMSNMLDSASRVMTSRPQSSSSGSWSSGGRGFSGGGFSGGGGSGGGRAGFG